MVAASAKPRLSSRSHGSERHLCEANKHYTYKMARTCNPDKASVKLQKVEKPVGRPAVPGSAGTGGGHGGGAGGSKRPLPASSRDSEDPFRFGAGGGASPRNAGSGGSSCRSPSSPSSAASCQAPAVDPNAVAGGSGLDQGGAGARKKKKLSKNSVQEFYVKELKTNTEAAAPVKKIVKALNAKGAALTFSTYVSMIAGNPGQPGASAGMARDIGIGVKLLAREYPNIGADGYHQAGGSELDCETALLTLLSTHPKLSGEEYHLGADLEEPNLVVRANLRVLVRTCCLDLATPPHANPGPRPRPCPHPPLTTTTHTPTPAAHAVLHASPARPAAQGGLLQRHPKRYQDAD